MRRAIWLIVVLTALGAGGGLWADTALQNTADKYIAGMATIRAHVLAGEGRKAAAEQAYWHALWEHDESWLNYMVSHHHTRDASVALGKLYTALEQGWDDEAIRALDEAAEAFREMGTSDALRWENVL